MDLMFGKEIRWSIEETFDRICECEWRYNGAAPETAIRSVLGAPHRSQEELRFYRSMITVKGTEEPQDHPMRYS